MHNRRGKFIVLEGADGAGTTTVTKEMISRYSERPPVMPWFATREPRRVEGSVLREVIENKREMLDWHSMHYLFMADRCLHMVEIEKMLVEGVNVISDRYYPSTLVYQSAVLGDEDKAMDAMHIMYDCMKHNPLIIEPDLMLFLEVKDLAILEQRRNDRGAGKGGQAEAFDKHSEMIVEMYGRWYNQYGRQNARIWTIDAEKPLPAVLMECDRAIEVA